MGVDSQHRGLTHSARPRQGEEGSCLADEQARGARGARTTGMMSTRLCDVVVVVGGDDSEDHHFGWALAWRQWPDDVKLRALGLFGHLREVQQQPQPVFGSGAWRSMNGNIHTS